MSDGRGDELAELLAGAGGPRLGRRDFLRLLGLGAGAMGGGALLSACGVSGEKKAEPTGSALKRTVADYWAGKQKTGQVDWAQWPLYIDVGDKKGDHPSVDAFTKATGVKVKYSEVIQDTGSFFAKVRPTLAAGQYTGYDVATITNGVYFHQMRQLGYLLPLDHSKLTNFKRYAGDAYKRAAYDPGNVYSVPWQSGITGIAYDESKVPEPITSFMGLFDPRLKGKVGMFGNTDDLPNPVLVAMFGDPAKTGPDQWRQAADKLKKQRHDGIVRKYYEQGYIDALSKGDIWACQAWSGDVFQALASGAKHLKFVIPREGAILWTDNLVLLKGAKHPVDAMLLMDYYFQPDVAAQVAEWVNYITPVPAAQRVVLRDAAKATGDDRAALAQLARSPLVFPTEADYRKLYRFRDLDADELRTWNDIFEPVYQS